MNSKQIIRFWKYVERSGPIPSHMPHLGQCWIWTGLKFSTGYGRFAIANEYGKTVRRLAHRVAFELSKHEPGNLCVLHSCDTPLCCNPDHLFLGTVADNARDCNMKGRRPTGDKNGLRLHPEARSFGDRNGSRLYPERLRRGDNHPVRINPSIVKRGESHASSKLTNEKVKEILRSEEGCAALGRKFGVSEACIRAVKRRLTWKNVAA